MVSRSKSRKTIGPCSSSAQASTFRRFPMSPLEQREGRSLWVMRGRVSGLCACTCVFMCVCVRGEGVGVGAGWEGVVGMVWWKYVLGDAWQHGHRASLIPLLVLFNSALNRKKLINLVMMAILRLKGQMLQRMCVNGT